MEAILSERTITRAEITDALVSQVGLTRQDSSEMLDLTLEIVVKELEKGTSVKLSRFGNFVVREKSAREGRNPKTGEQATISARKVVTFRPSPMLKERVDQ